MLKKCQHLWGKCEYKLLKHLPLHILLFSRRDGRVSPRPAASHIRPAAAPAWENFSSVWAARGERKLVGLSRQGQHRKDNVWTTHLTDRILVPGKSPPHINTNWYRSCYMFDWGLRPGVECWPGSHYSRPPPVACNPNLHSQQFKTFPTLITSFWLAAK